MSIVVNNKTRNFVADKIGKYINSPEQRLIQGATALFMQPVIDYFNHSADDETRAVSVARTIGKIIAGTCVGVAVRYGLQCPVRRHCPSDPACGVRAR